MANSIITTEITARVLNPIGSKGFGFLIAGEGEEEKKYFLHVDVLRACGFIESQLLPDGVEVIFDAGDTPQGPRVVRIHAIGALKAAADEAQLTAALEPKKKPQHKKPAGKKPQHNKKKPVIKGRRPQDPVAIELAVGDVVAGQVTSLDWDKGFGFARVVLITGEDGELRKKAGHEKVSDLFILTNDIAAGDDIDDALEAGRWLVMTVIELPEGKKPRAQIDEVYQRPSANVVDLAEAKTAKG